jgi:hypothetical protein
MFRAENVPPYMYRRASSGSYIMGADDVSVAEGVIVP